MLVKRWLQKKERKILYTFGSFRHFAFGGTAFGWNGKKAYCFTTKFIFSPSSSLVLLSDLFIYLHSYWKQMANYYEKKCKIFIKIETIIIKRKVNNIYIYIYHKLCLYIYSKLLHQNGPYLNPLTFNQNKKPTT